MEKASKKVYAFFDVDETLISIKSMFSFQEYWYSKYCHDPANVRQIAYEDFMATMRSYVRNQATREEMNRRYYEFFAGRCQEETAACARAWFEETEAAAPDFYQKAIVSALKTHQENGEEPVLVSGSLMEIVEPLAERLGVEHILATKLSVSGGRFTGRILPPQMIGTGKAMAVRGFLERHGVDPIMCHAYGDDLSDIPMLEQVGNSHIVAGNPALAAEAGLRGWQFITV